MIFRSMVIAVVKSISCETDKDLRIPLQSWENGMAAPRMKMRLSTALI